MQATFRNSVLEMLKRGKHMQTPDILQINTKASIWLLLHPQRAQVIKYH